MSGSSRPLRRSKLFCATYQLLPLRSEPQSERCGTSPLMDLGNTEFPSQMR